MFFRSHSFRKAVNEHLKRKVLDFSKAYVGKGGIFPTKNGMPKVLTQFLVKPYKFGCVTSTKGITPRLCLL